MAKRYFGRPKDKLQELDQCRYILNSERNLVVTMEGRIVVVTPLGDVHVDNPFRGLPDKPRAGLLGWHGMKDEEREVEYQKEVKHWKGVAEKHLTKGRQVVVEEDAIHPFIGEYARPVQELTTTGYARNK